MRTLKLLAALAMMTMLSACADEPPPATDPTAGTGGAGAPAPGSEAEFMQVVGDRVFFDTDQHSLDGGAQAVLARQAQWMLQYPGVTAVIEGHADERGTRAYNLALGARRAESAFRFLVSQGVPADRLRTVTYGKERPVAACSDESCWSQNRRAVTVVAGAPTS